MEEFASAYFRGTGAAINISLGWYPDVVVIQNLTDGDKMQWANPMGGRTVMVFSSGGTNPIVAGDTIKGATSGARGKVTEVIIDSGTWAAGTAAGWFILDIDSVIGTFAAENVYEFPNPGASIDDATGAAIATFTEDIAAAVANATGNAAVALYRGVDASLAKGFTIGSTISEANKLFAYHAFRNSMPRLCANSAVG